MDKIRTEKLRRFMTPGAGVMIPGAANTLAARIAGFETVLRIGAGLANSFCARQM